MYSTTIYFQYCSYNTGIVKINVVFVLKVASGFSNFDFTFFVPLVICIVSLKTIWDFLLE